MVKGSISPQIPLIVDCGKQGGLCMNEIDDDG